jgi:hypothetical protein
MTGSHVLIHYPNARIRPAREKAWKGRTQAVLGSFCQSHGEKVGSSDS